MADLFKKRTRIVQRVPPTIEVLWSEPDRDGMRYRIDFGIDLRAKWRKMKSTGENRKVADRVWKFVAHASPTEREMYELRGGTARYDDDSNSISFTDTTIEEA